MGFIDYYKLALQNYATFTGRSRRSEYWYFFLGNFLIAAVLMGLFVATESMIFYAVYMLYALAVFIPSLAVAVRRLHDTDKSGWFLLIGLIPLVGGIILLVFMATEGTRGPNKYGPDPKNPIKDDITAHLVD